MHMHSDISFFSGNQIPTMLQRKSVHGGGWSEGGGEGQMGGERTRREWQRGGEGEVSEEKAWR